MFYYFISETQIKKAKFPLKTDDRILFSSDVDELAQYGIYPLVETPMPTEEGYYATPKYRLENNVIVREWELVPLSEEPTDEDYLDALAKMGVDVND